MKELSCGFLVFNKSNGMLACHPTGRKYEPLHCYDIPKGHLEEGESALETAKRELKEETGLVIPDDVSILNMGKFFYRSDKDLIIFVVKMDYDFNSLHCDSTFEMYGKKYKEMDSYEITYNPALYFKNLERIVVDIMSKRIVDDYLRYN